MGYEEHREIEEGKYLESYETWVSKLSTKQKRELGRMGLLKPDPGYRETKSYQLPEDVDMENMKTLSYKVDMSEGLDRLTDQFQEMLDIDEEKARKLAKWHYQHVSAEVTKREGFLLQRIVAGFIGTSNAKLSAAGLAFAADLAALNGLKNQAEYARKNNVSRSIVSRHTKFWSRLLELRPSSHMKSEEACEKYAEIGKTQHWRKKKYGKRKDK